MDHGVSSRGEPERRLKSEQTGLHYVARTRGHTFWASASGRRSRSERYLVFVSQFADHQRPSAGPLRSAADHQVPTPFPRLDDKVISMSARGMSPREIVGHLREL